MPQLEMVPENVKVVERGKYEDVKTGDAVRSRHTSVVSSGPSVLRSTLHETPKSQLSPGIYDDTNARRTPVNYQSPMSRSSPMMNRVSEGTLLLSGVRQVSIIQTALCNPFYFILFLCLLLVWRVTRRNFRRL